MTRREWISCLPVAAVVARGQGKMPDVETAKIAVEAQREFGLRLLREVAAREAGKNAFLSPLSLFLALQMTGNGAAGATRAQMWKTLALPDRDVRDLNASATALQDVLRHSEGTELAIANALWADEHLPLAPDFIKLCALVFHAQASSLKFKDPASAEAINKWVRENTKGKIDKLVTAGQVASAHVILTNAVYFAGKWRSEFPESETKEAVFHLTGGATKMVPMMHQARLRGAYRSSGAFEGAMLFYRESPLFFYVLLPNAGTTPRDVLATFKMNELVSTQADADVDLKLPRFNLDYFTSVAGDLKKMGMELPFQFPGADFKPMGSELLYISDVVHKTRLEVDEKGTVAAAASAVIMRAGSAMQQPREVKTLVFDRPFVVMLGDAQTGALLFAGVIEEP